MVARSTRDKTPEFLLVDYNQGLQLSPDFLLRVALGRVPGATRVAALGYNPSVDTATTPEDAWTLGGLYPWPAAAFDSTLKSDSVNDSAAGTGPGQS